MRVTDEGEGATSSLGMFIAVAAAGLLALLFLFLLRGKRKRRSVEAAGRWVLVTGAASGFGRAVTRLLLEKRCRLFAVDLNKAQLLSEFGEEQGVITIVCDVTDPQQVSEMAKVVERELQGEPLFGVVNNAGIGLPPTSLVDHSEEEMLRVINVNALGMWRVSKALFPLLQLQDNDYSKSGPRKITTRRKTHLDKSVGSCIVNVTSVAGRVASAMMGSYAMSKFAGEALTDVLRQEMGPLGVRVVAIQPHFSDTGILGNARLKMEDQGGGSGSCHPLWDGMARHSLAWLQEKVKLLPAEQTAKEIVDCLFDPQCPSRVLVCWRKDRFALRFLWPLLSDRLRDRILLFQTLPPTTNK
ncbi:putative short-chain dehydrogenase/reductase [Balamuthia mandrillaris]